MTEESLPDDFPSESATDTSSGILQDPVAAARAYKIRLEAEDTSVVALSRHLAKLTAHYEALLARRDKAHSDEKSQMAASMAAEKEQIRALLDAETSALRAEKEQMRAQLDAETRALRKELDAVSIENSAFARQRMRFAEEDALALARFPAQVTEHGMAVLNSHRAPLPPSTNGFDVMQGLGEKAIDRFAEVAKVIFNNNPELKQKVGGALGAAPAKPAESSSEAPPPAESAPAPTPDGFDSVAVFAVWQLVQRVPEAENAKFFSSLGVSSIAEATCRHLLLFWAEFSTRYPA